MPDPTLPPTDGLPSDDDFSDIAEGDEIDLVDEHGVAHPMTVLDFVMIGWDAAGQAQVLTFAEGSDEPDQADIETVGEYVLLDDHSREALVFMRVVADDEGNIERFDFVEDDDEYLSVVNAFEAYQAETAQPDDLVTHGVLDTQEAA